MAAAHKELNHKIANDGVFYMELHDFFLRYNIIYVIRLTADDCADWKKIKGEWKGESAGGDERWLHNPQYSVSTNEKDNRIVVCLSQSDQRGGGGYQTIGLFVLQTNGPMWKTNFQARRDQSIEFVAQPTSPMS